MASVTLNTTLKNSLRVSVMNCMLKNVQTSLPVITEKEKKFFANGDYIFERIVDKEVRDAAETIEASMFHKTVSKSDRINLRFDISEYADTSSPFCRVSDSGKRELPRFDVPKVADFDVRRWRDRKSTDYRVYAYDDEIATSAKLSKPSLLVGQYSMSVKLSPKWDVTYHLQRRYAREKYFLDTLIRYDGFVARFLSNRSSLGKVRRDWPELINFCQDSKLAKLGKTVARGKPEYDSDDALEYIELINGYAARGLLLPAVKDYNKYFLF